MNNGIVIGGVFLLYTVLGMVAQELGLTATLITIPNAVDAPGGGGFWQQVTSAIAPLLYVFNAVGSMLQMLAFQMDVPPLVNLFLGVPMNGVIWYLVIRLIRGGG